MENYRIERTAEKPFCAGDLNSDCMTTIFSLSGPVKLKQVIKHEAMSANQCCAALGNGAYLCVMQKNRQLQVWHVSINENKRDYRFIKRSNSI